MNFRYLAKSLIPTAEAAAKFFRNSYGVTGFRVEEAIDNSIGFRPALHATMSDHHILCVEVSETPYPSAMDAFVLDCMNKHLPVKAYVAFPSDPAPADYKAGLERARSRGVGVLEISASNNEVVAPAISLSLMGLRVRPPRDFPAKYRGTITDAVNTFRNGAPPQGCMMVYQEIESLSRKLAKKTKSKGMWRALKPGEKAPNLNLERGAWAKVMEVLIEHLDYSKCPSPDKNLLIQVAALTSHRNDTGHKPASRSALATRDQRARTRFEHASDVLVDLIAACAPLRL